MYLVLAEKPSQASEIKKYMQNVKKEGRAFIGKFKGKDLVVIPLAGHIMRIPKDLSKHSEDFDEKDWTKGFDKLPFYPENSFYKREVSRRDIYNQVKKYLAKCDKVIVATDPDIEGASLAYEVLMFNKALDKVIDYIDTNNIILVNKLLENSINGKKSHLDFFSMAYQGMIRTDLNYGVGINITRYLMVKTNSKTTFGTQQTRLLNEITKRTIEFMEGKKNQKKFYNIVLETEYGEFIVELNEEEKFDFKKVKKIAEEIEKIGILKVNLIERKEKEEKSLKWYDGSDVAQEASSILKISPLKLLDEKNGLLEHLYLKGIMTYPRGDAKGKMPLSQLELQKKIANSYKHLFNAEIDLNLVKKDLWYKDGEIQVNHTPYTIAKPDIDINSLSKDEKVVFDIVLKRLLSVFTPNPISLITKIKAKAGEFNAILTETSDVKRGWRDIYKMPVRECKTKNVKENEEIKILKVKLKEDITKPKPLYTEKSIISFMKKKNIGTQATYASLIETISSSDRPYIIKKKSQLIATKYAQFFLSIIPQEAINVLDEFEEEVMKKIGDKKISLKEAFKKRNELIQKTFEIVKSKIDEEENLKQLKEILDELKEDEIVGKCPKCKKEVIEKKDKYQCKGVKWEQIDGKWKNVGDCDFQIKKVIETDKIKINFTKKQVKDLLEKYKTKVNVYYKKTKKSLKKDVIIKNQKVEILF